jgi:uncharacterized OsmC-like protein/alpha/beta superfamily hydrolase
MKTTRLSFTNDNGEELSACLEFPVDQHPKAYALFAHCFTCNKNLLAVNNISKGLTANGIAVLRFDFTGLGESEGDFSNTNFSSNVNDLLAAVSFLERDYQTPALLIGHSLGGAAVLFAATKLERLQAVVTIGAPSDPKHVQHLIQSSAKEIEKRGVADVNIGGRTFTIRKQFLDDLIKSNMGEVLKGLRKPLLILHSPQDQTVEVENAAQLYHMAHHPKSFISLDGADHLLSNKVDSRYVGELIGAWVRRYIEFEKKPVLKSDNQLVARVNEGFATEIRVGKHLLIADEPEEVGGTDFGPSPYDYLSAALAACTAMTLRMYADRKKWPLEEVMVHLDHGKVHCEDCENVEQAGKRIDHFSRSIVLEGELTSEQRNRLVEIADKCPVHKTLHQNVSVTTTLVP